MLPQLLLGAAGAALSSVSAQPGPGHPHPPRVQALLDRLERAQSSDHAAPLCDVVDYGARCDNASDDTAAIQAAIDRCPAGSAVALPSARICLSRGIALGNGTRLRIPSDATLRAVPDPSSWDNRSLYLVHAGNTRNTSIFGGGTIDGSGAAWWSFKNISRPHLFNNVAVQDYTIRDVTLINSGRGILGFGAPCSNVVVDGVTIREPAIGNSDGIDLSCDGFVVQNSFVQNGDDSICMKSTPAGTARNGLIRNCTVKNGEHLEPASTNYPGLAGGLVLGTALAPGMENITYSNCTVIGALAGIRIKFRPSQNGFARNIVFERIRIIDPVVYAIDIFMSSDHEQLLGSAPTRLAAPSEAGSARAASRLRARAAIAPPADTKSPWTVDLQNVTIRGVDGVLGAVPPDVCGAGRVCPRAVARFSCSAEYPCRGMRLEHVHVAGFKPYNISDHGHNVEVPACSFADFEAARWADVLPLSCKPQ